MLPHYKPNINFREVPGGLYTFCPECFIVLHKLEHPYWNETNPFGKTYEEYVHKCTKCNWIAKNRFDGIICTIDKIESFRREINMKIKFTEHHSFVGESMTMEVEGIHHNLEMSKNQTYAQHAVKILKDVYNIDYDIKDVKFEWDGSL